VVARENREKAQVAYTLLLFVSLSY